MMLMQVASSIDSKKEQSSTNNVQDLSKKRACYVWLPVYCYDWGLTMFAHACAATVAAAEVFWCVLRVHLLERDAEFAKCMDVC